MRKATVLVALMAVAVFSLTASAAHAWDICLKDPLYITQYQFNLELATPGPGALIRGQAILPPPHTDPDFPAPLAGHVNLSTAVLSMTIGYKATDASRHYIYSAAAGLAGATWGILADASYYDNPRATVLEFCTPADLAEEGETGAPE